MKKNLVAVFVLCISVAILAFSGNVLATSLAYSDTNVGGPLWDRPVGVGPGISGLGPVNYHVFPFISTSTGLHDILSVQDYDGYLHLYQGSFDPLDQLTGLIAANDDYIFIGQSFIDNILLNQSIQYFLVTSAFANGQVGNFTNTIDPVPEPATMLLLGTGLVGVAGAARRRKKNQA